MYNSKRARESAEVIKKLFMKASPEEKKQLILMMQMAGTIALSNARDDRRYKRKDREEYLEIGHFYKTFRRDLENMLKEEKDTTW